MVYSLLLARWKFQCHFIIWYVDNMVYWCKIVELYLCFRFCVSKRTQLDYEITIFLFLKPFCICWLVIIVFLKGVLLLFIIYAGWHVYLYPIRAIILLSLIPVICGFFLSSLVKLFYPCSINSKKSKEKMWSSG